MISHQYQITNVLPARARLGEGPIWSATEKVLYWVDIYNHRVNKFNSVTGQNLYFDVGDVVGSIAIAGENRLIMAQRNGLTYLNTETGEVEPIISVEADLPENRFNDGKCDSQGRFWFGSMCPGKPQGSLYRYDPDGSLHRMETGLTIANGLGWSPDDKTFYLTDSAQKQIYAYKFEPSTGNISDRQVFVDLTTESFYPDGLAIDQQGNIWSAMWDGWCVICFNPKGEEIWRINLPVQRPTSCTFGGENLDILYITSASVGLSEEEIQKSFYSGDIFSVSTAMTGLSTYTFSPMKLVV
ncbi:SMP-30/Gluconolaconase/LRE domain protein [Richelia sinica FACHB-800]|uniref:SMP-30/Gluconolaconase/LRE domain protein n=1 Tax=Richelia sinica FACHB-800 TaxID=1357546 RepID=A0A975TAY5_9NOST|nr:SMP-30/gluconolactonase/LRE family protein [Richelia sinica]MBD2664830.1 SMP-30/gluconolactonase/LRE family protein [Richelia sinica FACHB-800]QXE25387.1 SMP-30/Gluconolaconase/LRE domain protein [Richelia sinica FACHB-800]